MSQNGPLGEKSMMASIRPPMEALYHDSCTDIEQNLNSVVRPALPGVQVISR